MTDKEKELQAEAIGYYRKQIADLKKENAELKLKLEALDGQTPWKDIKDKSEVVGQLTKAKEIIKEFLSYYHSNNYPYQMLEILGKAEQFLNSEVEK